MSTSQEDYLEAILALEKSNRVARVKDIAELLSVRMPSVTSALKQLQKKGLIEYEKNSYIVLSPQGKFLAENVRERHNSLAMFFKEILLLNNEKAQLEACNAEHAISQATIKRLSKLSKYIKDNIFSGVSASEWESMLSGAEAGGK